MPTPFRVDPRGPAGAYKTYRISMPSDVMVRAACEEVGCLAWRYGWVTHIDESTDIGRQQAAYIRRASGRTFQEHRDGPLTVLAFEPGQRCFANHETRPQLFQVRAGDWRQHLGVIRDHVTPADWVDDFATHQDRIRCEVEKG